ncbi:MAG: serine/threonine-protein kinase, partial [Planctomycetota bacterium]
MPGSNPHPSPEAWYRAEDAVLRALQRGAGPRRPPLEFPGFDKSRELFCGGQGRVYAAVRRGTGEVVAIKVLREDHLAGAADQRRFEREIEIVSALQHPHLVPIIGHGRTVDDRPYLVMPFIEGAPLDEHVLGPGRDDPGRLDVGDTLRVFLGACDAVHYAHQHGIIHRDLKPGNIRVDRDGQAHVLDFGLAVEVDAAARRLDGSRAVTSTGAFLGSLAFASPEQVDGAPGGVDIRTDVYSLGVVLYQLLTGRLPHDTGGSLREALKRITESLPPSPGRLRAMHDDVETIVQRCLAKRPDRRYQSAGELATDIRRYLAGEPIEARRDSAWERAQLLLRRYRYAAIAGAVVLLLLVGATTSMTVLYGQAERARAVAQQQRVQARRQANAARAAMTFLQEILSESDPVVRSGT